MYEIDKKAQKNWNDYWTDAGIPELGEVIANDPYYRLIKHLLNLTVRDGKSILEIGSGSGMRTIALLHEYELSSGRTVLVDFSRKALQLARGNAARCGDIPLLLNADAFRLPFSDGSFDVVYSEGLAEHYDGEARQEIFHEMHRVCKKNGQVSVIVPNARNIFYRFEKRILERRKEWAFGFEKPFFDDELTGRMKNAGLVIRKKAGAVFLRQIVHLARTIAGNKEPRSGAFGMTRPSRGATARILAMVERFLERKLWFAARDLGFSAVKGNDV